MVESRPWRLSEAARVRWAACWTAGSVSTGMRTGFGASGFSPFGCLNRPPMSSSSSFDVGVGENHFWRRTSKPRLPEHGLVSRGKAHDDGLAPVGRTADAFLDVFLRLDLDPLRAAHAHGLPGEGCKVGFQFGVAGIKRDDRAAFLVRVERLAEFPDRFRALVEEAQPAVAGVRRGRVEAHIGHDDDAV